MLKYKKFYFFLTKVKKDINSFKYYFEKFKNTFKYGNEKGIKFH